jgi:hypothetical protein
LSLTAGKSGGIQADAHKKPGNRDAKALLTSSLIIVEEFVINCPK